MPKSRTSPAPPPATRRRAPRATRRGVLAGALAGILALPLAPPLAPRPAAAAEAAVIDARVDLALERLHASVPGARTLTERAVALLVMPQVVKGGFIVGGTYGEGALRLNDGEGYRETTAYYAVAAASIGLQAGIQETSHVIAFLTEEALARFRTAEGWEVGADAEITVLDRTANLDVTSTAFRRPLVAIVFAGSGLLVGASLEGAKYTPIAR